MGGRQTSCMACQQKAKTTYFRVGRICFFHLDQYLQKHFCVFIQFYAKLKFAWPHNSRLLCEVSL